MYYSQQGEDKFIYENYLKHKNGFFIELGAMDGIQYSNTLFFEKSLSWNGILIEPTNQYNNLIKNRPNCHNFNYAISQFEGEIEFVGNGALGGIKSVMPDGHYFGWGLNNEKIYKVPTIPIYKIIDKVNEIKKIDKVDLFSVDVEGAELEVLKTYNWSTPTYLVLIEMAAYDLEKNEMCRKILLDNNFEFKSIIGCNEIWVNKNIKY